jgi:large subunit ribosomal protein L25
VLWTVPIAVKPLDVPNFLELDVTGMAIGDVKRVEDLTLPDGADFEIDVERTVVTINAPMSEEALEELEAEAGIEQDEPELEGDEDVADTAAADDDADDEA